MKITCTEIEREQLCNGATLCYFITRNNYCNEKDGCNKCREENIEWESVCNPLALAMGSRIHLHNFLESGQ